MHLFENKMISKLSLKCIPKQMTWPVQSSNMRSAQVSGHTVPVWKSVGLQQHSYDFYQLWQRSTLIAWADLEGGQGVRTPSPLKNHKNIGFLCNTGPDPLKNHKATKPAIIGPQAKCHFNDVLLAGRWWPIYSGICILYPLIN